MHVGVWRVAVGGSWYGCEGTRAVVLVLRSCFIGQSHWRLQKALALVQQRGLLDGLLLDELLPQRLFAHLRLLPARLLALARILCAATVAFVLSAHVCHAHRSVHQFDCSTKSFAQEAGSVPDSRGVVNEARVLHDSLDSLETLVKLLRRW